MGSPAYYGGLQAKDVIIKGSLENNRLKLIVKRGAKTYGLDLATESGTFAPAQPLKDSMAAVTLSTGAQTQATKDPAWKKLQKYDIVMLIDQSGSMADDISASGLSKWDWCRDQLTTFASQSLANTGKHFTIVTFNGDYHVRRDCDPEEVQQTFVSNRPGGGTDMSTPLDYMLNDYMSAAHANPLLVVVLTDGVPAAPHLVQKCIVDITKRMSSPDQIKIVFFEIGYDQEGQALISLLDDRLQGQGALYDIVDSNTFTQLQKVGLKQALYESFNRNLQSRGKIPPSRSLQSDLDAVRKQLQEARARGAPKATNQ
jgi:hypothetical protein